MPKYYSRTLTVKQYDGSEKRLKFRGKTPQEAELKLQEAKLKQQFGVLAINSGTTFGRWVEEWKVSYGAASSTKGDFAQLSGILDKYFTSILGSIRLCDLRPMHLQQCANCMAHLSKSSINKAKIVVNRVMRKALVNKLITDNVAEEIVWPKGTEGKRRALYEHERAIFLKVAPKHPHGLFFAIMFGCGLRNNEVRALKWSDIDLDNGVLTVSSAVKKDGEKIGPPKSAAGVRTLPIPPWLLAWLKSAHRSSVFVEGNTTGGFLSTDRVKAAWRSLRNMMAIEMGVPTHRNQVDPVMFKECSISELTPYNLRHTYCTMLAENGVSLRTAQYLMGHSTIDMTAKVYTHITQKMLDTAKEQITAMWEAPPQEGQQVDILVKKTS